MCQDQITEQCSQMNDEELVKSLTRARDDYSDEFRRAARLELTGRGIDLEAYAGTARVSLNGVGEQAISIDMALGLVDHPITI